MKHVLRMLASVASAMVLLSCSRPSGDATFEKQIVGKWRLAVDKATITTTYKSDHTFAGHIVPSDGSQPFAVTGTWSIRDGRMSTTVTTSTAPQLIAVGFTSTDKLISFSDKTRTFNDGKQTITETRME